MALSVFSDSPNGARVTRIDRLKNAGSIIKRLREEGHTNLRVGRNFADSYPADQWLKLDKGVAFQTE